MLAASATHVGPKDYLIMSQSKCQAVARSQRIIRLTGCCLLGLPVDFTGSFTESQGREDGVDDTLLWFGVGQKPNGLDSITSFIGGLLGKPAAGDRTALGHLENLLLLAMQGNKWGVGVTNSRLQIIYQF